MWRSRVTAALTSRPSSIRSAAFRSSIATDRGKLSVRDAERTLGSSELDAVAPSDDSALLAEQIDAGEPCWVIFNCSTVFGAHGDSFEIRVCPLDSRVSALAEPETAAAATVADNIANLVALGMLALRGGEVAVDQDDLLFPFGCNMGTLLQELANGGIELAALVVGRTNDQCAFSGFICGDVFEGDGFISHVRIFNLADALMRLEDRERAIDLSFGRKLHCFAKHRVPLAANRVQPRDRHTGLLHLVDGSSRLDRVVLTLVADEDDPFYLGVASFMKEAVDLAGREQARFIDDPEFLTASSGISFSSRLATVRDSTPASDSALTARWSEQSRARNSRAPRRTRGSLRPWWSSRCRRALRWR